MNSQSTDPQPAPIATPTAEQPPTQRIERRELLLLTIVLAVGMGLRLWAVAQSAVEHFDEGVYASNFYFGPPDYAYPQRKYYAPPLLPALIETGMIVGLPPNLAALLPSFLAGCGTIVALCWFGRSWFSPGVGLAAATLAALSDFHVAYSAAALTDVLLGLWLVLAVDALTRSLAKADFRWAIGAGLYTGLAWWTKYNGWLPLAIGAAALPLVWLMVRPPRKQAVGMIGCWLVAALVAGLVWLPYYLSLRAEGGYGPIAANHAKYVVGFSGWLDSASRQVASQHVMEGPWSWLAVGASLLIAAAFTLGTRRRWLLVAIGAIVLSGLSVVGTAFLRAGGLATFAPLAMRSLCRGDAREDPSRTGRATALSLILAWWIGITIATPCYSPYPRLVLPWLLATWLCAAVACEELLSDRWAAARPAWLRCLYLAAVICLALVAGAGCWLRPSDSVADARDDRQSLLAIARRLQTDLPAEEFRAFYLYGEPALYFQLAAAGERILAPIEVVPADAVTANGKPISTYLVVGPHALGDVQFREQWSAIQSRWKLVLEYDDHASPLVWLDLRDPRSPLPALDAEASRICVYRLR